MAWGAVVAALRLLLAQRTFFVQGLVAQTDEASGAMLRELDECRQHLGLHRRVSLRFSPNAASPAVCGLLRPVILVPQNLASRLHGADLQAVLYHELAHVQRGDLWINLLQTLLQIVYFYNPLLWLANAIIRRIREKAVDEAVLVAMGEAAPQYPQTLVNVAKLAFTRRPTLSLRLIGVVESKSALSSRIKHILNRLADYRGQFVLLSFWQPVSHPELDRLRELHKTYGGAGKLAIIDFGGWDTLAEVRKYVAEHKIEWPEIYFGPSNNEGIANQYGLPGVPYILLVDPQGKIVATWLRTEKLMQAVRDAIGEAK